MGSKGYTLVELMVAIAILGIVSAYAVPSFKQIISNKGVSSTANDLVTILKYARSEAIRRGDWVYVSPVDSESTVDEWGSGVRVWSDDDQNEKYQSSEELRVVKFDQHSISINVTGDDGEFYFNPRGELAVTSDVNAIVCDSSNKNIGRQIAILNSGLVSVNTNYSCL